MPEFSPTVSQKAAIETTGRSVLVSAGAGSGKTKVLTERLMRYVLDRDNPVDLDRFVIITYTRASAGELRTRITDELITAAAEASKDPRTAPAYLRHIRRQQALVGKAQIGTIHHFCSSILRENCHLTALPPDFKILSEERADVMKDAALQKVLEARYDALGEYPGFEKLVNSVGTGRDDSALTELVLSLYNKMQCHAFPKKWAEDILAELGKEVTDISETIWGKEILSHALDEAEYLSRAMDKLLQLAASDEKARAKFLGNLSVSADGIRELVRCIKLGWDKAGKCPHPDFPTLKRLPDPDDERLAEALKDGRSSCKKKLGEIYSLLASDTSALAAELREVRPAMKALFDLVLDFDAEFSKGKIRAGYADYSDLEHMTAALLIKEDGTASDIAKQIADTYREIMVDEYQDVSRVQDAIFSAVSKDGSNLFLVGDVKQAIYRFRLSDAEIFNEKYRAWTLLPDGAAGESGTTANTAAENAEQRMSPVKILLRENFRSRQEILDCANSVFRRCMSEKFGDVEYNEEAALVFSSKAFPDESVPSPELLLVPSGQSGRAVEAEAVAKKIEALIAGGTTVSGRNGLRPLEYGDIAILLRSANSVGGIYRRALTEHGIPVVTAQGGGFFETREISLMLAFLKVLDNPHRDPELVAVLSSPLYGFTPDELAEIRACSPDTDLWDAVNTASSTVLPEKLSHFIASLAFFRSVAPDLSCDALIRLLLSETGIASVFSAMPDGEQKESNLNRMIRLAADFEKDGSHGFHRFVQHLTNLSEKNSEISCSADRISAVQIISIHRSKGLEYPVVFLCDTAHRFNKSDSTDSVLVHPDLGLGPKIVDSVRRAKYPTIARRAINLRIRRETLSEELRLLYVAMTRPKERLFITAAVKDPEGEWDGWRGKIDPACEKIEPELLSGSQNYLGWLLAAAAADGEQHLKVRVFDPKEAPDLTETTVSDDNIISDNTVSADLIGTDEEIDPAYLEELSARLSYIYPHREASALPSKVTATELKSGTVPEDEESMPLPGLSSVPEFGNVPEDDKVPTGSNASLNDSAVEYFIDVAESGTESDVVVVSEGNREDPTAPKDRFFRFASGRMFRHPDFSLVDRPLTATEKGIATHLTLQHMDLQRGTSEEGVRSEIQRLCELGFLSRKQAEAVNSYAIVHLFRSPLGKRILNAPCLHREFRFSLLRDAASLFGKAPGEKILLQGVVDCCIEEEDGLVIIDYKTDSVWTPEQLEERKQHYAGQVQAYASALSGIFEKPVKETVLYFLTAGKECVISY